MTSKSRNNKVNIQISNESEDENKDESKDIIIKIKTVSGGIVVFGGKNTIAPITINPPPPPTTPDSE